MIAMYHLLGHLFRDRVDTPINTWWTFLRQTLSPDHSCRDAVHRRYAWRVSHAKRKTHSNATLYFEAGERLPQKAAGELTIHNEKKYQQHAAARWHWNGHGV